MLQFFGSPDEIRAAQERAAMENEALSAAVGNFYDGMTVDQMRSFSVILKSIVAHSEHVVAAYHLGQATAMLRYKFHLCGCGEDHLSDEHEKMQADKEDQTDQSLSLPENSFYEQLHAMAAYKVKAVPHTKAKVQCTGKYTFSDAESERECMQTWESLDERMMMTHCPNCGAGPS